MQLFPQIAFFIMFRFIVGSLPLIALTNYFSVLFLSDNELWGFYFKTNFMSNFCEKNLMRKSYVGIHNFGKLYLKFVEQKG